MGDEVEEEKGMLPGGKAFAGIFVLRVFLSLSLSGGNLRGGIRGGFQQNIHQFSPVCSFRVVVFTDYSVPEQGVINHCNW